jgi:integrase/recombinase XerD
MRPTDFATHLTAFLTRYLPAQRNVSPNTIKAYRDAFVLLLRYCRDVRRLAPDRLSLEQIDPPLVLDFLDHLEKERRCKARTRNLRLTALHAFFRYLQTEEPGFLLRCQRILAIPLQRQAPPIVEYLSPESGSSVLKRSVTESLAESVTYFLWVSL